MVEITLKGRKIPLIYTLMEMKAIQEELGPTEQAIAKMYAKNPEDNKDMSLVGGKEQIETLAAMIRIMGNAGLEEAGEEGNLTDKGILRALKPAALWEMAGACLNAINEGMNSEIPEKEQAGPVDVTLEEIRKKNEKGD